MSRAYKCDRCDKLFGGAPHFLPSEEPFIKAQVIHEQDGLHWSFGVTVRSEYGRREVCSECRTAVLKDIYAQLAERLKE